MRLVHQGYSACPDLEIQSRSYLVGREKCRRCSRTKGLVPRDEFVDKDEISLEPSNLDVVDAATLWAQPIVAIERSDPQSRSTRPLDSVN
jgi:flavoprotein